MSKKYDRGYTEGYDDGYKVGFTAPRPKPSWIVPGLVILAILAFVVSLAGTTKKWVPPPCGFDEQPTYYEAPDGRWYPEPTLADPMEVEPLIDWDAIEYPDKTKQ